MQIEVPARRYLTHAKADEASVEANFRYEEKVLHIETDQTALILVDCWDHHYIESHLRRAKEIVGTRLAPFAGFCRNAGILVVHAPGLGVADRYTDWMENPEDWDRDPAPPDWPPEEFRQRTGPYAELDRGFTSTPLLREWMDYGRNCMGIMPELGPVPGDVAIADGVQLHALLSNRRLLHLLYAGFATNWCVPNKDYGMRAMAARGYNIVLLRDATTAVETHETYEDELMKRVAIQTAEMMTGFSSTCDALKRAYEGATKAPA